MSWRDESLPMDERVRLYQEEQDRKRREFMEQSDAYLRMIQEVRKHPYPRLGDEGTIPKGPRLRLMLVQEPPKHRRRS